MYTYKKDLVVGQTVTIDKEYFDNRFEIGSKVIIQEIGNTDSEYFGNVIIENNMFTDKDLIMHVCYKCIQGEKTGIVYPEEITEGEWPEVVRYSPYDPNKPRTLVLCVIKGDRVLSGLIKSKAKLKLVA